jgi:hypothetical protein
MRSLIVLCLLSVTAHGETRTWTINYTTDAELVEVHGDIAFLKSGDQIERVPISRLSTSDQQFIASMPLAPINRASTFASGDAQSLPLPNSQTTTEIAREAAYEPPIGQAADEQPLPIPVQYDSRSSAGLEHSMLTAPTNAPILNPPSNTASQATYISPSDAQPRGFDNTNSTMPRQFVQQFPQQQTQAQPQKQRRSSSRADRPGLFGGRARRLANERQ